MVLKPAFVTSICHWQKVSVWGRASGFTKALDGSLVRFADQ
jgi:hypothetical protein